MVLLSLLSLLIGAVIGFILVEFNVEIRNALRAGWKSFKEYFQN